MTDFLLPHEMYDAMGVPNALRDRVAYQTLVAKYCALVEAVMQLTGGEPVRISLDRVQELVGQDHTTDPREIVMVAERKPNGQPGPDVDVCLAGVDEIREANHRYALSRMGSRRN